MKTIKELKISNENGLAQVNIKFEDGSEFCHAIDEEEKSKIQNGDRLYIENMVAKYSYRDKHATVGVYRYLGHDNKLHTTPSGYMCGQCKHFQQTSVYYSELSLGNPNANSWPYPIGVCKKHGFGPSLSSYRNADGRGCGWELADWCKLNNPVLSEDEEKRLIELLK